MSEIQTEPAEGVRPYGELKCPDGTKFVMYADGSWDQQPWDGSATFRTSAESESMTAADLAEYRPDRAWTPAS